MLAVSIVWAVAAWVVSPRYELEKPSLVDDWWAIEESPEQLPVALRLGNPETQRFRPGLIVWNYLQWHTFDAPRGRAPNIWNLARLLVLVAGLALLTLLALPPPHERRGGVILAGTASLSALLVVTTPAFAIDLARFGPQEPLLIGAMALGGSLLVLAAREVLATKHEIRAGRTIALAVAGSAFWIFGVYQKEASICVLPLLVAAVVAGRGRLTRWKRLPPLRRMVLASIGAVFVLPLLHVTVETVAIARGGNLVYGAEVDRGAGAARGLEMLIRRMHETLGLAPVLVVIAAIAVVALSVVRRNVNALAVGALVSGAFGLLFAGQAGFVESRYYLTTFALFATALTLGLASFGRRVLVLGAIAFAALGVASSSAAHDGVEEWAVVEREWGELLGAVSAVDASGCRVALAGFDLERTQAIPVLVALEPPEEPGRCAEGETYLVIGQSETGAVLLAACAPGAATPIREWYRGSVYRCDRLVTERLTDPELGRLTANELVGMRSLDVP